MPHIHARVSYALIFAALSLSFNRPNLGAQNPTPDALPASLRAYRASHDVEIVRELSSFLAIPNLASDRVNIRRNAEHLLAMMTARGISAKLLESPSGGPPAVYGELPATGATKTVVFYAHYDGQPVDTTQWITPPWQPVLRDQPLESGGRVIAGALQPGTVRGEWRVYGRSSSDDKAPIEAILAAIDALRAAH